MRISRDLLDAGIYTNNVDERDEIDIKTLNSVNDTIKLCLLNSNNGMIKKEDCIMGGTIVQIQTAILAAGDREGREKAAKEEKQRMDQENLRKASEGLLDLVENWDYSQSADCNFRVKRQDHYADVHARQTCKNIWDADRHISLDIPSEIVTKIRQKLDLAKTYHQQINKRAKELVDQRVSKAISEELKRLYDGALYKRVGPKFERIN